MDSRSPDFSHEHEVGEEGEGGESGSGKKGKSCWLAAFPCGRIVLWLKKIWVQ